MVFAANHQSHLDTPLLLTSLPDRFRHRAVVAAGADYFFDTRVKATLSALVLGALPVERGRVDRRPLEQARALLDDGWSLVIFPEGGRSPDGWAQPFRGGAAYLSMHGGFPVVPVHLDGTGRVLPKGAKRPSRAAVHVTFGAPLRPRVGRARPASRRASRRAWPSSPTSVPPTGGRLGAGRPRVRRPRSPGPTQGRGDGPGRWTADGGRRLPPPGRRSGRPSRGVGPGARAPRDRRVALVVAYAAAVTGTLPFGHGVRPLFEGIGPPPAYRWVKPPAAFAAGNIPPKPSDTDIPMGPTGSQQAGAQSEDNQLVLNLAPNAAPPHPPDAAIRVHIELSRPGHAGAAARGGEAQRERLPGHADLPAVGGRP